MEPAVATIIAAAIGLIGTVASTLLSMRSNRSRAANRESYQHSPYKPSNVIIVGLGVTMVIVLGFQQIDRIEQSVRDYKIISDFPDTIGDIERPVQRANEDAISILQGGGPKTYNTPGRNWDVGDVVFVDRRDWIEELDVTNPSRSDHESCFIEIMGILTIEGFSTRRKSALIKYTAPTEPDSGSSECRSNVRFFYRME